MTIPLSTTTITVRQPGAHEPYETPTWTILAAGVRAHISAAAGLEREAGGTLTDLVSPFGCDLVDGMDATCQVVDDTTGEVYEVVTVEARRGLGLDRMSGQLRRVGPVTA